MCGIFNSCSESDSDSSDCPGRTSESDFCGDVAGYTVSNTYYSFDGTYTSNPANCTIAIATLIGQTAHIYDSNGIKLGDLPHPTCVGTGPMVQHKILSPHFIKEIRGLEGTSLERVYEGWSGLVWYD